MSKKTLKELREAADAALANRISSKASLIDAVPILVQLQEAVANQDKTVKECRAVAKALTKACAKYGLEHESIFDEGLSLSPIGVKSGDLTIEDTTYHFASGYDKIKRIDGGKLSQDFLATLPKEWTKQTVDLDTTAINRLGINDEKLEEAGLHRPEKDEWSLA